MLLRDRRTGKLLEIGWGTQGFQHFLARRAKRLRAWERAMLQLPLAHYWVKRVTLTYAPGHGWEPRQITDYLREVREWLGDRLAGYMWWAELQQRGVPHYHLVLIYRKGGLSILPAPDTSGMWPYGMSTVENLDRPTVGYALSKYGTKREQLEGVWPRGMHKFAVWIREGSIPKAHYWGFRLTALPEWLERMALMALGSAGWEGMPGAYPRQDPEGAWWIGSRPVDSPWLPITFAYQLADGWEPV